MNGWRRLWWSLPVPQLLFSAFVKPDTHQIPNCPSGEGNRLCDGARMSASSWHQLSTERLRWSAKPNIRFRACEQCPRLGQPPLLAERAKLLSRVFSIRYGTLLPTFTLGSTREGTRQHLFCLLISVAYAFISNDLAAVSLQSTWNSATMASDIYQQPGNVLRLIKSESRRRHHGADPDQRLVELVRLLARHAARQVYEAQTRKGRRKTRS